MLRRRYFELSVVKKKYKKRKIMNIFMCDYFLWYYCKFVCLLNYVIVFWVVVILVIMVEWKNYFMIIKFW